MTTFIFRKFKDRPKKFVSGNAGDEKNLHPGCRKFIFLNRFSGNILFSSLVSFVFLYSWVCFVLYSWVCFVFVFFCLFFLFFFGLFVCLMKLKFYILIHIRLCGWMSDKKNFTRPISGNKTTFIGHTFEGKETSNYFKTLSQEDYQLTESQKFWNDWICKSKKQLFCTKDCSFSGVLFPPQLVMFFIFRCFKFFQMFQFLPILKRSLVTILGQKIWGNALYFFFIHLSEIFFLKVLWASL